MGYSPIQDHKCPLSQSINYTFAVFEGQGQLTIPHFQERDAGFSFFAKILDPTFYKS